jgi:site-specific DNA-methyltransferase (adenine-specific)
MIELHNCDNIDLLKSQQDESVDLIYSDILYGTGRNFGDYQDLKPIRSEIESHYLPRLIEMKRVLKNSGSIYLQMDTRINHWVRCLMDDIFGYNNFKNEIIWGYRNGGMKKTEYPKKHDVILFYTLSKNYTFKLQKNRKTYVDKSKGYNPYTKYFKDDFGEYCLGYYTDVFILDNYQHKKQNLYPTQKPEDLIKLIIETSSNENDLICDYYLGSGTTAKVCQELNRNFIGCDISLKAIEISKKRINSIELKLF